MKIIFLCIGLIAGFIVGTLLFKFKQRLKISGVLRVDTSDPEDQPYLFLELSEMPLTIKEKKYVIFKVNPQNYISHK